MKNYYENEALKYIMYLDATTYMDGLRVNILPTSFFTFC